MNYYKATIQYDGTNFCGFQWQKDLVTVQDEINKVFLKLIGGKITTVGASRTDTGVHALHQIVKITSEHPIDCGSTFLRFLNESFSSQIKFLSLDPCEGSFNPIVGCSSKEYRYFFTNTPETSGREQRFIANNPYELNIDLMKKCAEMIVGKHDFHNFCTTGSNVKTTIREVTFCELSEVDPHAVLPQTDIFLLPPELNRCYQLRIESNGFLKHMVRHLMRSLLLVGSGKLSLQEFALLLNGPKKTKSLWKTASPRGLFLYRIHY